MSINRPTTLGVIACPGGKDFAQEVITHLRRLYRRRWEKKVAALSNAYSMTTEEVARNINFDLDLHTSDASATNNIKSYRVPEFLIPTTFTKFANGEFKTELNASVRGMDLFIVQDLENHYPIKFPGSKDPSICSVNDHIFALITAVDAAFQSGCESVTVVTPSYPYARQHKKKGREGLTASRIGRILENMGVQRIITLDIHSKEIENTFSHLSLENLHGSYQILRKLKEVTDLSNPDLVVVSPDTGAVDRNKYYASALKRPLALLYKERDYSKVSQAGESNITATKLLGDVKGKTVFMADDMLGTGGTFIKAFKLLRDMGAVDIIAAVSLPLFSGDAIKVFDEAYQQGLFTKIIGTNAVYHEGELLDRPWYSSANVTELFAQAITRLHNNRSLSSILDNGALIQKLLNS